MHLTKMMMMILKLIDCRKEEYISSLYCLCQMLKKKKVSASCICGRVSIVVSNLLILPAAVT